MATPERVVTMRGVQGIDRSEDSRLSDPGSWYATQNLWGRSEGMLAKRPGSLLLIDGRAVNQTTGTTSTDPAGQILVPSGAIPPNILVDTPIGGGVGPVNLPTITLGAVTSAFTTVLQGTFGLIGRVNY